MSNIFKAALFVALTFASPALADDTQPFQPLDETEIPLDLRDEAPPPALTRSGVLADLNDAGAVAASRFFDGFTFFGDARIRYEGIFDDTTGISDRNRGRLAVRLGFTQKINPRILVGARLATGTASNPASTFQSFDNVTTGKVISIDNLYLDLTPFTREPNLHFVLGKHTVPFRTSTLVWDRDISLEGVSETWKTERWPWSFWTTAGQYFLEDNAAPDDPYLLGEQVGFEYAPAGDLGTRFTLGTGLYHTVRPYGIDATSQSTANLSSGRHRTPSGYSVLDLSGGVSTLLGELPIRVNGGWIRNLSADLTTVTGEAESDGWSAELTFGKTADPGTWELGGGYRVVEADATLGQFTESEFSTSSGNTDIEGWYYKFAYVPWKNTTWTVSGAMTQGESNRPIADRARIETNLGVKF